MSTHLRLKRKKTFGVGWIDRANVDLSSCSPKRVNRYYPPMTYHHVFNVHKDEMWVEYALCKARDMI